VGKSYSLGGDSLCVGGQGKGPHCLRRDLCLESAQLVLVTPCRYEILLHSSRNRGQEECDWRVKSTKVNMIAKWPIATTEVEKRDVRLSPQRLPGARPRILGEVNRRKGIEVCATYLNWACSCIMER
jgi:hypothetical protein